MKNLLCIVAIIGLLSGTLRANLQYLHRYTVAETSFETVSTAFVADTSEHGTYDDAVDKNIPIGFDFTFNDTVYTSLNIDSNGNVAFVNIKSKYKNKKLPRNNRTQSIYAYWDDMNPDNGGSIKYGTIQGNGVVLDLEVCDEFESNLSNWTTNGSVSITDVTSSSPTHSMSINRGNSDTTSIAIDTSNNLKELQAWKRIPRATIRYAIEAKNISGAEVEDVTADDTLDSILDSIFDYSTIRHLQITNGACDCLGVSSANSNGPKGTSDAQNKITLDFDTISAHSGSTPTKKCGYFEVGIK